MSATTHAERGAELRKARHAIMRKLQRADWAMQEDDDPDAMNAVFAAVRLTTKHEVVWADGMDALPDLLGRAVSIVIEGCLTGEGVGSLLGEARTILVREGEDFRGCDYGM